MVLLNASSPALRPPILQPQPVVSRCESLLSVRVGEVSFIYCFRSGYAARNFILKNLRVPLGPGERASLSSSFTCPSSFFRSRR